VARLGATANRQGLVKTATKPGPSGPYELKNLNDHARGAQPQRKSRRWHGARNGRTQQLVCQDREPEIPDDGQIQLRISGDPGPRKFKENFAHVSCPSLEASNS